MLICSTAVETSRWAVESDFISRHKHSYVKEWLVGLLKGFSTEYRKTKSNVITTANQRRGKYLKEPMRKGKTHWILWSAGKRGWRSRDWFYFCFWLVERVAQIYLDHSQNEVKRNHCRRSIENSSKTSCAFRNVLCRCDLAGLEETTFQLMFFSRAGSRKTQVRSSGLEHSVRV